MNLKSIKAVFLSLSIGLGFLYAIHLFQERQTFLSFFTPIIASALLAIAIVLFSSKVKETSLKSLNITALGLILGYFLAQMILMIMKAVDGFSIISISKENFLLLKLGVYLVCSYMGMAFIWQAQDQWALSIPFIRLIPSENKKKDFLLDGAILTDPRLIDLAMAGLFDQRLILPRFILTELRKGLDSEQEIEKNKCRRAVEIVQKLDEIPGLNLKIVDHDFPEIKEINQKLIQLARILDAYILTADPAGINSRVYEGVKFINIITLSNALKPIVQSGETLSIKIQRYGKEPLQGIGYLDDGTMVVVNGGSEFLGETIPVQVLSVKHTSTGRMIFCNSSFENRSQQRSSRVEHEVKIAPI